MAISIGPNGPRSFAVGSEAALCLVDIDKPDIQLPEEMPIFPHRTPFIEELNHVLDKHQVMCYFFFKFYDILTLTFFSKTRFYLIADFKKNKELRNFAFYFFKLHVISELFSQL